jgi:carbon storage regulator
MLVLSRDVSQSIAIGDNISISVVDIGGGRVRLGIDAPKEIKIVREELLDRQIEFTFLDWFLKK